MKESLSKTTGIETNPLERVARFAPYVISMHRRGRGGVLWL